MELVICLINYFVVAYVYVNQSITLTQGFGIVQSCNKFIDWLLSFSTNLFTVFAILNAIQIVLEAPTYLSSKVLRTPLVTGTKMIKLFHNLCRWFTRILRFLGTIFYRVDAKEPSAKSKKFNCLPQLSKVTDLNYNRYLHYIIF